MPPRQIHIRIRDLRRQRSLTQEELAEALGLSRQSVNAMEAGRCLPSLPVAFQLATFFGVPLHVIVATPGQDDQVTEAEHPTQLISNQGKEEVMNRLTPWSPLREMREMLDEMMDDAVNTTSPLLVAGPAVNVAQDEHAVHVEMRLPGYKKEDLNLEVGDGYLTISGQTEDKQENDGKQFFRREFTQTGFSRTVSLPSPVVAEQAKAEMRHGILFVTLPKQVEEKPKTTRLQIDSE